MIDIRVDHFFQRIIKILNMIKTKIEIEKNNSGYISKRAMDVKALAVREKILGMRVKTFCVISMGFVLICYVPFDF